MLLESEFRFDVPPEAAYDGLLDPEILGGALPGTNRLQLTGEDRYEGEMEASVGPVTAARFAVLVELKNKVRPEGFDMHVDGRGKAGFVQGIASVALEPLDGGTLMKYRADLQVGGRVASVGQRLLDSVGKTMSRQGLETVNRSLNARLEPSAEATDPSSGRPVAVTAGVPATRPRRRALYLIAAIILAIALVLLL